MSSGEADSEGSIDRRASSNVKLMFQLCTRVRQDLELLKELMEDASGLIQCVDSECGAILDMTGRRMMRETALSRRRLRRQNGVDETG